MAIKHDPLMALRIELSGRRFKQHRKRLGLSRYTVARISGVSYRALELWDKNRVVPATRTAIKVGRVLGLVTETMESRLKIQESLQSLKETYKIRRANLAQKFEAEAK